MFGNHRTSFLSGVVNMAILFLDVDGTLINYKAQIPSSAQTAAAQTAISVGYIWVETIAYVICAILIFFFTIEKNLPEEQKAIAARKNK